VSDKKKSRKSLSWYYLLYKVTILRICENVLPRTVLELSPLLARELESACLHHAQFLGEAHQHQLEERECVLSLECVLSDAAHQHQLEIGILERET
jgi:hypothetical protein